MLQSARDCFTDAVTVSDFVHFVLREYRDEHALTQIQRPQYTIDKSDASKQPTTTDVSSLVSQHGPLRPSNSFVDGATITMSFQTEPGFPSSTPFVWTVNAEKGEIQMASEQDPGLNARSAFLTLIGVQVHATDEVRELQS